MKKLFSIKKILVCFILVFPVISFAEIADDFMSLDRTQLVSQQVDLLKNRLTEATDELKKLQRQQALELNSLSFDKVSKPLLNQANLDISVAKSNLDSLGIELTESQQTVTRLEKITQEIENQLNVVSIFGSKMLHVKQAEISNLQAKLERQEKLLELEQERLHDLQQLQTVADKTLQVFKNRSNRIESLLKSQTIVQLREHQAKTEMAFQKEQASWVKQLTELNDRLGQLETSNHPDIGLHKKLIADIFYVNENVNFSYLQMLIARYQDQILQLRDSVSRGGPITLLNKIHEESQVLSKQLMRVKELLKTRIEIIEKQKNIKAIQQQNLNYTDKLEKLSEQYRLSLSNVEKISKQSIQLQSIIDKALQQELASRQSLPGLDARAWLDMGGEFLLLPSLAFHVVKNLFSNVVQTFESFELSGWAWFFTLEFFWLVSFYYCNQYLVSRISKLTQHEGDHVNLRWLCLRLFKRNIVDIALIGNLLWLFYLYEIPFQNFEFFIHLSIVWIMFKFFISLSRLYLFETVHDREGKDVRLYYQLKWTFIVGGIVTALAFFVRGLPVSYEFKDLFARLFLVFLLVCSVILLKHCRMLPSLIVPHIDNRRTYLKKVVSMLGWLVPLVLIINSVVGLLGYVNLVYTISWYEGVFLVVLAGYLILRGIFIEIMEFFSNIMISHVSNGWLWTEAFLKPIDRVLRIVLFLTAWTALFLIYGWDRQSPVVERLNKLIHYRFGEVLNSVITPLSIIELAVIISLLYWAAKWTREFVYRLLLSRTQDLGIRNSIAILSQYTMIVVGILIGLRVLGVDFRALTVVAGAFAVTAGLGLRDLLNNIASGFLLLIERPLRVGDTVTIGEYEGEVTHIGSRAVTVRTWDHVEIFVPNAEICTKTFVNWTSKDNIVRTVMKIHIDQHESPQAVQEIIYDVLLKNNNVLKDPAPEVFLKELLEGNVELEIRYYVNLRLIKSRPGIRSEVLLSIWEAFEHEGIRSTYPAREIYLKNPETLVLPQRG